jgi:hypothetical protein
MRHHQPGGTHSRGSLNVANVQAPGLTITMITVEAGQAA